MKLVIAFNEGAMSDNRDAEIARLRRALEPFAAMVVKFEDGHPTWHTDELGVVAHCFGGREHTMRLGDFRRAQTALQPS